MGYVIRIAFWIILPGCLLAKSLLIDNFGARYLLKHVTCPSNSTFYAPRNVEKHCITTALDCVRRELYGTVQVECEDPKDYVGDAVHYLDHLIEDGPEQGHAPTASSECACERWPEKPFADFVGDVLSLLEFTNSVSNP